MSRCRICSSNDRDALVEELAAEMWATRIDEQEWPYADCGPYWQNAMREFAEATVRILEERR